MRALQISGLVLIAIGVWIIIRPPSYSREESVFKWCGARGWARTGPGQFSEKLTVRQRHAGPKAAESDSVRTVASYLGSSPA